MEARDIMKKYLGNIAKKRWKDILLEMEVVSSGIKPGFLYDYSCVEPSEFSKMVADLAALGLLDKKKLHVLSLEQDVLLVNIRLVDSTICQMHRDLEEGRQVIMDVSLHLEQPKLVDDETVQQIKEFLGEVVDQLQQDSYSQPVLELQSKPKWNISTLFGILVGYPVVYWFNKDTDGSNPLSMASLRAYRVAKVGDKHHFYSFSVPEVILPHFEELIDDWFQKVQSRTHIKLKMTYESKTVSFVAL